MNAALIIVQVILTTHDKTNKLINYKLLKKNPHIDKKIQKKSTINSKAISIQSCISDKQAKDTYKW